MSQRLELHPHPCRACGGRTHFMTCYVDDEGVVAFFHDTCVGSWLTRNLGRSLQFAPGVGREVGLDLMEVLKRSLAVTESSEPATYTGPRLVIE